MFIYLLLHVFYFFGGAGGGFLGVGIFLVPGSGLLGVGLGGGVGLEGGVVRSFAISLELLRCNWSEGIPPILV